MLEVGLCPWGEAGMERTEVRMAAEVGVPGELCLWVT